MKCSCCGYTEEVPADGKWRLCPRCHSINEQPTVLELMSNVLQIKVRLADKQRSDELIEASALRSSITKYPDEPHPDDEHLARNLTP